MSHLVTWCDFCCGPDGMQALLLMQISDSEAVEEFFAWLL